MFGKKNEKLETLKDLIDSRAGYIETIQMLDLNKKEKDVFLRASLEVRKNKPNLEIIEQAYEILLDKSGGNEEPSEDDEHTHNDLNTSTQDDDKILDFVKETIGESSKFMEHINKYDFSKNEKAVLSGAFSDLKKEKYDIDRIHSAYEIIRKYENGDKDISQSDESKNQESSSSFCSNCGAVLSENINFCSKCGTAVLEKDQKFNINQNDSAKGTQKSIRTSSKLKSISKYGLILILVVAGLFLVYNSFFSVEYAYERQLYKESGIIYKKSDNRPYTGIMRSNYSTGERKVEADIKNGKPDSLATGWYKNGRKEYEKNYNNGKLEGVHIEWYRSGQKKSETNFKNDKLDGLGTQWYENGQKKSEVNFKNGKLDGLGTQWYENGQKEYEGNSINGKKDGLATAWHKGGNKKSEYVFKNGKPDGLTIQWYENGQKKLETNSKNAKLSGLATMWYENGQKKLEENYKNGNKDGLTRGWYEDGKKEKEANFKNGKLDGLTRGWYENGQKKFELNLKNDKFDGLTTQWYENGQKEIDQHYKNGKLEGLTRSWHKDGSVKAMEMYSNGILKKEW